MTSVASSSIENGPVPAYSALSRLLLFYSLHLPGHRGKWRIVQFLRKSLNINLKGDFLVERQKLLWLLDPSDFPHYELFWFGVYDEWQFFHIFKIVRPDDVFLDIGSNLGYYSVTLGARLPKSTIHAFEPNPPTFQRLSKHISLNKLKNVFPHAIALGNTEGTASLTQKTGNSGRTELIAGDDIQVTTLDRFCSGRNIRKVDILKIDVEGFEDRVLAGGAHTLNAFKPHMIIEVHPAPLLRAGSDIREVFRTIESYGYLAFEARRKKLVRVNRVHENDDVVTWFCFHRDKLPAGCTPGQSS